MAVQGEKLPLSSALQIIRSTLRRADKVRKLLRTLGDADDSLALSLRFKRMRKRLESAPISDAEADLFAELTLAVQGLNFILSEKFYPG